MATGSTRVAVALMLVALIGLSVPARGYAKPPTSAPSPAPSAAPAPELTAPEQRVENVIAAALHYLGVPYRLGAEGPDLMDCSGLIYRAFTDAGEARRMSGARLGVRSYVRWFAARGGLVLDEAEAVRGDLAIWGAGQHMGIYLGDGRVVSALMNGVRVHALHGISLPLTGFLRPNWGGEGKVESLDPSLLFDQSETPVTLVPASAWAPVLDPSLEGAQPQRAGEERIDLRSATSRTFENPDGTFTTELHAQPIYYQGDDSTDWLPIDLRFTEVKGRHHQPDAAVVGASPVVVSAFPSDRADGFLTLAAGESVIGLARGQAVDPAVAPVIAADGRTVDYANFYGDGTGLRLLARPDGVHGFLVLSDAPETNEFTFRVAGDGLTALLDGDGSVVVRDEVGATVGRIPRPTLVDSSDTDGSGGGVFTAAVSLSVATDEDAGQLITIHVARRFLEEAAYPAFVDLSVVDFPAAAPGADVASVSSRHPETASVGDERPEQPSYGEAWLGRQPGSRNDNAVYLRFDDPRTVIGHGRVMSAALELFPYWGNAGGVSVGVNAVTTDWTPGDLSWLTQPAADLELGSMTLTPGTWSSLDLVSAAVLAHGLRLAAHAGPDTWTRLIARDQSEAVAFGPRLVVTWSATPPEPTSWSILEPMHSDD